MCVVYTRARAAAVLWSYARETRSRRYSAGGPRINIADLISHTLDIALFLRTLPLVFGFASGDYLPPISRPKIAWLRAHVCVYYRCEVGRKNYTVERVGSHRVLYSFSRNCMRRVLDLRDLLALRARAAVHFFVYRK